jgi:hypothetical protein
MEAMKKLKCSGFCQIRPVLLTFLFTAHLYTTIDMASWVMLHALLHTVLCPLVDLKRQASRPGYHVLEYRAASLEEWLERWLNGEELQ